MNFDDIAAYMSLEYGGDGTVTCQLFGSPPAASTQSIKSDTHRSAFTMRV